MSKMDGKFSPLSWFLDEAADHVAWEYTALLAAALTMPDHNLVSPINHQVQVAFLAHARNLAQFFNDRVTLRQVRCSRERLIIPTFTP